MAKITITIEDTPKGVKCTSDPSFEKLCLMAKADALTSAHGYAFKAINSVLAESKKQEKKQIIYIPKLRGGQN